MDNMTIKEPIRKRQSLFVYGHSLGSLNNKTKGKEQEQHIWQTPQGSTKDILSLHQNSRKMSEMSQTMTTQNKRLQDNQNDMLKSEIEKYDQKWRNRFHEQNGIFFNLDELMTKYDFKYDNVNQLYEFGEVLGEGSFSMVHQAKFIPTGEQIAVKIIKPEYENKKGRELAHQEAELLFQLDHPNIIKIKHLIQINGKLYMGMELLRGGSLQALLKKDGKLSDTEAATIMKCVLSAVSYIHDKGIIHRDMKTANILIKESHDLSTVKIIDFGFGERNLSNASYDSHVGTLVYMAPEVAFEHQYTKSVDVWAIGIIMHYVISGKHPFYDKENDGTQSFKNKLQKMKQIQPCDTLSWVAQNLFQRLTTIQAHARYTCKDALRHPWVTRNKFDKIPDNFIDKMSKFEQEQILKQKIQTFFFLNLTKTHNEHTNFESNLFQNYKRKINNVAQKIKNWHDDLHNISQEEFQNDQDYAEQLTSPNYFSDSSEEISIGPTCVTKKSPPILVQKSQFKNMRPPVIRQASKSGSFSFAPHSPMKKKTSINSRLSNKQETKQALTALGISSNIQDQLQNYHQIQTHSQQIPNPKYQALQGKSVSINPNLPVGRVKQKLHRSSYSMTGQSAGPTDQHKNQI